VDDKLFQAINTILIVAGTLLTIVVNFRRFLADRKRTTVDERKAERNFLEEDLERSRKEIDRLCKELKEKDEVIAQKEKERQETLLLLASLTAQVQAKK
jgi:hypothetical protein